MLQSLLHRLYACHQAVQSKEAFKTQLEFRDSDIISFKCRQEFCELCNKLRKVLPEQLEYHITEAFSLNHRNSMASSPQMNYERFELVSQ